MEPMQQYVALYRALRSLSEKDYVQDLDRFLDSMHPQMIFMGQGDDIYMSFIGLQKETPFPYPLALSFLKREAPEKVISMFLDRFPTTEDYEAFIQCNPQD